METSPHPFLFLTTFKGGMTHLRNFSSKGDVIGILRNSLFLTSPLNQGALEMNLTDNKNNLCLCDHATPSNFFHETDNETDKDNIIKNLM